MCNHPERTSVHDCMRLIFILKLCFCSKVFCTIVVVILNYTSVILRGVFCLPSYYKDYDKVDDKGGSTKSSQMLGNLSKVYSKRRIAIVLLMGK